MITKTFKLTIATDTEEQMRKEEEHLSMTYGAEKITEGVWIPCSEQEPTVSGEYMITWVFKWNDIVRRYIGISRYDSSAVEWYKNSMMCTYEEVKVVAWMPLPEPYKEVEE